MLSIIYITSSTVVSACNFMVHLDVTGKWTRNFT